MDIDEFGEPSIMLLRSEEEEALYRIVDTGYPLIGDEPTVPTEKAPDGRPIYDQREVRGLRPSPSNMKWFLGANGQAEPEK